MDRPILGVVGLILAIGIGFGVMQSRKSDAYAEMLLEAKAFVAEADLYDKHREHFDWLVETAHEDVASDAVTASMGGRRSRGRVEIDYEKYGEELVTRMIELARQNSYHDVAESLERLTDPDAEARQKQEKAERAKAARKK